MTLPMKPSSSAKSHLIHKETPPIPQERDAPSLCGHPLLNSTPQTDCFPGANLAPPSSKDLEGQGDTVHPAPHSPELGPNRAGAQRMDPK